MMVAEVVAAFGQHCFHTVVIWLHLIPVPLGRKKDPFCLYIRKPITQKVKRIPNTDLVQVRGCVFVGFKVYASKQTPLACRVEMLLLCCNHAQFGITRSGRSKCIFAATVAVRDKTAPALSSNPKPEPCEPKP